MVWSQWVVLFLLNFLVLHVFSVFMLYYYHRRRKSLEAIVDQDLKAERQRLEAMSNDLVKISQLFLEKMEEKEARLKNLMVKVTHLLNRISEKEVPVITRRQTVAFAPQKAAVMTAAIASGSSRVPSETQGGRAEEYFAEDEKFKEIYFLADKGVSLVEIARKTGKSKGEVDLVLSLRRVKAI